MSLSLSVSGVQVNEDLQSLEVGSTLDRSAVTGSDASGESGQSYVTFDFQTHTVTLNQLWKSLMKNHNN